MKTEITKFALRHKKSGNLLGVRVSSDYTEDEGASTEHILDYKENHVWLADTAQQAKYVRMFPSM